MQFRLLKRSLSLRLMTWLALGWLGAMPSLAAETSCAVPANIGDGWEVSTPRSSGFDAQALCAVLAGVKSGEANIHSVIVERHGRLVAELYRRGPDTSMKFLLGLNLFASNADFGPATLHDIRSVSKSVIGLLVGIAKQKGEIKSLAIPVLDFYPEYADLRSPERDAINLEHLLTMSSGLQWDEDALPNDETRMFWKPYRYVLARPLTAKPGNEFHYNSGGTAVLADILIRTSGKPLKELVRTELFEPLGITDWEWATDLRGREIAFTGLRMRPRDLAKIGRMLLEHGQWHGRQIVPADWVAESPRPHIRTGFRSPPTATYELQYGYQRWVGNIDWQGKKLDWSAGFGNGGQRLFMVPELDLTVVMTAGGYSDTQGSAHRANELFNRVVSTVLK